MYYGLACTVCRKGIILEFTAQYDLNRNGLVAIVTNPLFVPYVWVNDKKYPCCRLCDCSRGKLFDRNNYTLCSFVSCFLPAETKTDGVLGLFNFVLVFLVYCKTVLEGVADYEEFDLN